MSFKSDNEAPACPEILAHLAAVNDGAASAYGGDDVTARLEARFRDVFECDLRVFPVATGTAANVLSLSVLTPPYGAVLCHRESHINMDECGAPELFTGGAKLVPIGGDDAKLTVAGIEVVLNLGWAGDVHCAQPSALSLTQASECGTVYGRDEIAALAEVAHGAGMGVHMDGARFANALVSLGCTPAEMTWKAGVDVLSFGATKNGALGAEAVVLFDTSRARELEFRRKRGGHLFSKMRYLSAQLEAYLADDLWLRNAAHANAMAQRLADGLTALPGVGLRYPRQSNEVFVHLPDAAVTALKGAGFAFYDWPLGGPDCHRLVTAWSTDESHIRRFLEVAEKAVKKI